MVSGTVERERCTTIIAQREAVHIPMRNSGCESSVRPWSSLSKADCGGLDCVIHSGVCTLSTDPCGVVSERNNWGCAPTGIKCPDGASATTARRWDELVALLDSEKRGDKVLALRTTHDSRGDLRQSVGCNDSVLGSRLSVVLASSPPLRSLFRQSSTPYVPVLSSRDMFSSILGNSVGSLDLVVGTVVLGNSVGSPDIVFGTVVESFFARVVHAGTLSTNDVPVD